MMKDEKNQQKKEDKPTGNKDAKERPVDKPDQRKDKSDDADDLMKRSDFRYFYSGRKLL
jgi:hypothetical protein